jgi:alkaline phosphatase D
VNVERLDRWRRFVGADYWLEDAGSWRLIGLNSLLIGLGGEEEDAQERWLQEALESRNGRRVAMFAHKPLFVDDANEPVAGYWSVPHDRRMRLLDLIAKHDVALFASGHLHWSWIGRHANTDLVWAPPSSFILGAMERDMPGARLLGAAVHLLGDSVESRLVPVEGLQPYLLDDVVAEVYPSALTKKEAAE